MIGNSWNKHLVIAAVISLVSVPGLSNAAGGWLGLMVKPAPGVQVGELIKDGPADKAGLKRGDIIVSIDAEPVSSVDDFQAKINGFAPNTQVQLKILRDGEEISVASTVGTGTESYARPQMPPMPMPGWNELWMPQGPFGRMFSEPDWQPHSFPMHPPRSRANAWLGISMEPTTNGIRVGDAAADGPAAKAGLQQDDVITAVNGRPLAGLGELVFIVRQHSPGDILSLSVDRGGRQLVVDVELGAFTQGT